MGAVRQYAKRGSLFLCSSTYEDVIFGRLKAIAGGNTITDLAGRPTPSYLGYPIVTSETMLSALTAQNDKVLLMFGNFNLSSSFGARRGITVQILRERYAEKLQIGVLGHERFDIVNHDLGSTTVKGPVAALLGTT
jgi:HK97 family phage major capsid protein